MEGFAAARPTKPAAHTLASFSTGRLRHHVFPSGRHAPNPRHYRRRADGRRRADLPNVGHHRAKSISVDFCGLCEKAGDCPTSSSPPIAPRLGASADDPERARATAAPTLQSPPPAQAMMRKRLRVFGENVCVISHLCRLVARRAAWWPLTGSLRCFTPSVSASWRTRWSGSDMMSLKYG